MFIRVPEASARKWPIHKGFRKDTGETPYPHGVAGIFLCVFNNYEAPKNPLGAAAGARQLGGSKGLIV